MGPFGPALALACRIVLAAVLGVAALAKIADRRALPGRLRTMGVAPRWAPRLAIALPIVELAVALLLVAAPHSPIPAAAAVVLLAAFTVFLIATVGRAVPCPCFGTVRTGHVVSGPGAIVRNGLLLGMAIVATGSVDGARAGGTLLVGAVVAALTTAAVTTVS